LPGNVPVDTLETGPDLIFNQAHHARIGVLNGTWLQKGPAHKLDSAWSSPTERNQDMNAIPIDPALRAEAVALTEDFGRLLDELVSGHVFRCGELPAPPVAPGVYLLAEGYDVLHVGRTRNLQARRREQTGLKNDRDTASHAFRRAVADATGAGHVGLPSKRADLEAHPTFAPYFQAAKQRMRACDFRCVGIADPPQQATFEIFASIALGLPHELWRTH
jgi:hypothetical protein